MSGLQMPQISLFPLYICLAIAVAVQHRLLNAQLPYIYGKSCTD